MRGDGAPLRSRGNRGRVDGTGVAWQRSPCLGQCDRGSAAMIQHAGAEPARAGLAPFDPAQVRPTLAPTEPGEPIPPLVPQTAGDRSSLRLLRRVGRVDPGSLDSYRAEGGYEVLRRAVQAGPQGVIRELKDAKLLGRGGAAFPTGVKWKAVATTRSPALYRLQRRRSRSRARSKTACLWRTTPSR